MTDVQASCDAHKVVDSPETNPVAPQLADFYDVLRNFPGRSCSESVWNDWVSWKNRVMRRYEEASNAHHRCMSEVGKGMEWEKNYIPFPELTKP